MIDEATCRRSSPKVSPRPSAGCGPSRAWISPSSTVRSKRCWGERLGKVHLHQDLSGYHVPDEGGRVAIDGAEVAFGSAESAYTGRRFVHQDLGLVGSSSVLDNILLNAGFPSRFGTITREAMRSVREDLARVGLAGRPPHSGRHADTDAQDGSCGRRGAPDGRPPPGPAPGPRRADGHAARDRGAATARDRPAGRLDRRRCALRDPPARRSLRGGRQRDGFPGRAPGRHTANEHAEPAIARQSADRHRARGDPRRVGAHALRAGRAHPPRHGPAVGSCRRCVARGPAR